MQTIKRTLLIERSEETVTVVDIWGNSVEIRYCDPEEHDASMHVRLNWRNGNFEDHVVGDQVPAPDF